MRLRDTFQEAENPSDELLAWIMRFDGISLLHIAMRQGNNDIVNLLLQHGADEEKTDDLGRKPGDDSRDGNAGPDAKKRKLG